MKNENFRVFTFANEVAYMSAERDFLKQRTELIKF